jgi:type II secretory pathway pseudopilin PulG
MALKTHRIFRGFTLFELMLGMMITALITGAVAALLAAVAQGWQQSGEASNSSNIVMMTHLRLQKVVRAAKQLGAVRTGSIEGTDVADVLIWKADTNLDNQVQFSELALLEHTPADGKIRCYEVNYPSDWDDSQKTAADTPALADDVIYDDDSIDSFKAAAYVQATVLASGISGAEFHKYDGSGVKRPRFEYLLNFGSGSGIETEYGSIAVRTPATLPASQGGP